MVKRIRGLLICTVLVLLVTGHVERILKKPPVDPTGGKCPDCDLTQMPDGSLFWPKCDSYDLEKCGSDGYENYDCCVGYQVFKDKIGLQQPGNCSKPHPKWLECLEKMSLYGIYGSLKDHIDMMESIGHVYNDSYQTLMVADIRNNEVDKSEVAEKQNEVKFHIVEGRWYSTDLKDKQVLKSADEPDRYFHVTRREKAIIEIDCVELKEADRECTNGLVHVLSKPLTHKFLPNSQRKETLLKVLEKHEKSAEFVKSLTEETKAKLDTFNAHDQYTVLLPSPESWENSKTIYNVEDLSIIAENHVIEKLWCLDSFYNYDGDIRSPFDQKWIFDKREDDDGKVINTVTARCNNVHDILERDVVLNNGAVHMIQGPLIPDNIMKLDFKGDLPVCLEGKDVEDWWNYIKECDLMIEKDKKYTILMPVNDAMEWWKGYGMFKKEYDRFLEDKEYRCETLRYHVIPSPEEAAGTSPVVNTSVPFPTNTIWEKLHQELYKEGDDNEDFKSPVKFHYSKIIDEVPIAFKDTWITRIDKINVMPEKRIIDICKEREGFSITAKLLEKADFNQTEFVKNAPKNLYLVVKDENLETVFDAEGNPVKDHDGAITSLPFDKVKARNYSLLHTIPNYLWGGDLSYFNKSSETQFTTALGNNLTFKMDEYDIMQIGSSDMKVKNWPAVVEYNIPAIDGMIWVLDGPLECPPEFCSDQKLDIDDYAVGIAACRVETLGENFSKVEFSKNPLEYAANYSDFCYHAQIIEYQTISVVDDDEEG